ncbi:CHAD domain-containing protein [Streptomyces sp. ISL-10]|nr:CHAD domain-containing protein [Streptomyces sp. ISL-10]
MRSLRLHGESGADTAGTAEAARALRAASSRISGTLHTFRPLLDPAWADGLRTELGWLSATLAQEHACTSRLARLLDALSRLSGAAPLPPARTELPVRYDCGPGGHAAAGVPGRTAGPVTPVPGGPDTPEEAALPAGGHTAGARPVRGRDAGVRRADAAAASRGGASGVTTDTLPSAADSSAGHREAHPDRPAGPGPGAGRAPAPARGGALTVGAARAGALLERQLTLARTRAHSAALQALGSSRFHAVADSVALLASELPLAPAAAGPAAETLGLLAEVAERRLLDAVARLPLGRAAHPYNADALVNGLAATTAGEEQDVPWHEVRRLLRVHRYAQEVLHPGAEPVLCHAGLVLDHHRDAAEASEAAAAAARTPRIAPATAYALGVLHADQRHEVEAARFAFQQEWRHATVTVAAP